MKPDATATRGAGLGRLPTLEGANRIVIKVGSSLLVDFDTGRLNRPWLETLAGEIAALIRADKHVAIVSSGAIALGRKYLAIKKDTVRLDQQQAAAAAGQILLAHAYQDLLGSHDVRVAQILLTLGDTEDRRRYLNARSTLETLLDLSVVPIINENDSVATDEIRYGDNDRLAARVAVMCSADCLVLLSDVNGLYDSDPATNPDASLIPLVDEITPAVEALAGASRTSFGTGGMVTKLAAAKICMPAGCATVIANGHTPEPLAAIDNAAACTWFLPSTTPRAARKQWIAGTLEPRGTLIIDAGAAKSLIDGRSLLPVGVVGVEGEFERGDAVIVRNHEGQDLARGLAAYCSADIRLIMGHRTAETKEILGYRDRDEVIHRDNLVLIKV
ncbi:MAG: glutamate 5-kinase [Gammaproteobacteria bacterium]|nr:glutamate 5-kinase [Gammaproteobacteria bacterium]MDH3768162.1 glutamate 5-kinase [Gammaproteobacteria bacterium]